MMDNLKAAALDAVLGVTASGILMIDKALNIVYMNPWAVEFVNMEASRCLNRCILDLYPDSNLARVVQTGVGEKNKWIVRNQKKTLVTRLPIYMDGQVAGGISLFQDYAHMQENEAEIRQSLVQKGLSAKYTFDHIIHTSPSISHTIDMAKTYAKSASTILLTGESGCGKELFAQGIHNHSERKNKPFVALNCSTLSESVLESELFGYSEGSFTGAKKGGKIGLFQLADGGTIFLDEIGEIPLSFQAKFLRVLQEKQIRPVGSDTIIPIDVRIIAASNKDLFKEVEKKRFRLDLFYRINVLCLNIPPLRERIEDIYPIALDYFSRTNPCLYANNQAAISDVLSVLQTYGFPGNVRELENILERLALLLEEGLLTPEKENILAQLIDTRAMASPALSGQTDQTSQVQSTLESAEKSKIIHELLRFGGDKKAAAAALGMSGSTLWRKMKKYQI